MCSGSMSINWLFPSWWFVFSYFLSCLVRSLTGCQILWILPCLFTLYGYFCISINVLGHFTGIHISYLESCWALWFVRQAQSSNSLSVKVVQLCLTLCDPINYTAHGILQTRILEWVAVPFSRGIFATQGSNPGLLHCRWILYQLSHEGSPYQIIETFKLAHAKKRKQS